MSNLVASLTQYLENLGSKIPLAWYAFIGSIIDEVIAFVPSPLIPVTAGTLAAKQGQPFVYLFWIAFTGTLGKVVASYVTYLIADKIEDFFTGRFGKFVGLEKGDLEKLGKYFNGSARDNIILLVLRALPFVSTLPVSVLAGVIKIKPIHYIWTTFVGIYIRFMFYMIIVYEGGKRYEYLFDAMDKGSTIFKIIFVLAILVGIFFYLRKNWEKILSRWLKTEEEVEIKKVKKEVVKKKSE